MPCHTGSADKLVCRCLGVTEATIIEALTNLPIYTLRDLRACTGAGDGCTCCHRRLRQYIEEFAAEPEPSARMPLPVAVG